MIYRVVIHDRAMHDIERNAGWWAERHSSRQALRWYETLIKQIDDLKSLPEARPLCLENDEFPIELRELHCGLGRRPSYRAIFTIKGKEVHVLAVRRAAEDVLRADDLLP